MSGVSGIGALSSSIDLGPTQSIQLMFAKLQLAMAELSKNGAMAHMKDIETSQQEQKDVAAFLQTAREAQAKAKETGKTTAMTPEMEDFMKKHKISIDQKGNDNLHFAEEWEYNIKSLQAYQEQLGTATQQKMVLIQDFMGQYNSYLQGANSMISTNNQVLQSLAQGR